METTPRPVSGPAIRIFATVFSRPMPATARPKKTEPIETARLRNVIVGS